MKAPKYSACYCLLGTLALVGFGCSRPAPDWGAERKALQEQIDRQAMSINVNSVNVDRLFKKHRTAEFNAATTSGYERIDSDTGMFLVSCENVQPYLDGQKLTLKIGNLNYATYSGFQIKAEWGTKVPQGADYNYGPEWDKVWSAWQRAVRKTTIESTIELKPGCWNNVEVVLSPAKADELAYVALSIITNKVILKADKQP